MCRLNWLLVYFWVQFKMLFLIYTGLCHLCILEVTSFYELSQLGKDEDNLRPPGTEKARCPLTDSFIVLTLLCLLSLRVLFPVPSFRLFTHSPYLLWGFQLPPLCGWFSKLPWLLFSLVLQFQLPCHRRLSFLFSVFFTSPFVIISNSTILPISKAYNLAVILILLSPSPSPSYIQTLTGSCHFFFNVTKNCLFLIISNLPC